MSLYQHIRGELVRWARRTIVFNFEEEDSPAANGEGWRMSERERAWRVLPTAGFMPLGWYMLRFEAEAENDRFHVRLHPDYGEGFDDEEFFGMRVEGGRENKRICRFPRIPRRLCLVVEDAGETLKVNRLAVSKVFENFAIGCLVSRVHGERRHPKASEARRSEELLNQVWEAYDVSVGEKLLDADTLVYHDWMRRMEEWDATGVEEEIAGFPIRPLVSVVVPVWNTHPKLLKRCIESVREQSYSHWQLCIADDASTNPAVSRILSEYAFGDSRISVMTRPTNGHISAATNSALGLVRGEYVAFLDHDDELAGHALFEVVKALNDDEALEILYSDEDLIDSRGIRKRPHFKSGWNPELLRAHNYVTHLCVYRRELIEKAGGLRTGMEGAQDYDLLLRASALTSPNRIHHIPKILYHWRDHEGSTAVKGEGAKGYSGPAGRKALEDYLAAEGLAAKVEFTAGSKLLYRVCYALPRTPLVTLIIPTRDHVKMLADCVKSILSKTSYSNFEILIVDNQSVEAETHAWFEEIQSDSRVRVVSYNERFNYSAINNFGVGQARGEVVGLVNNDIEVISPGWLEEMVSLALCPGTGCVGAKLYYENGTIQHGGVILGILGCAGHAHRGLTGGSEGYFFRLQLRQNLSAVTGACLIVRREVYEEVRGMDEELVVAFNDVDFCLRVREAGYLNVFTPFAELFHFESKSRGYEDTPEKRDRFDAEVRYLAGRWGEMLRRDPYYNPNLTLDKEDFSLTQTRDR